jgi:multiple sugar transport system permease protein
MSRLGLPSRKTWEGVALNGIMIVIVVVVLVPIALTLIISFKDQKDTLRKPPVLFPCDTETNPFDLAACRWSVEGYERVLDPEPSDSLLGFKLAGRMFRIYIPNTLLYATVTAFGVTILAGMSGYAFSRYHFRGRGLLLAAILAITGVPLLTNILALYQMGVVLRKSTLPFDDRAYIIVVYLGFFLPLSVWIAKGFFDTIPRDLEEAALIDGASPLGALRHVTMPAALPGLTAIFLLTFVNVWNEFIAGYLLIAKNELKPVMFGLYDFLSANIINMQVIAAACVLLALPMVVVFLFARRVFFMAMVEGAVKG